MAGIGFELRRIMKEERLSSFLRVYGFSAVLSSGPWVISAISIIFVGVICFSASMPWGSITQFQTTVTYLLALSVSLIFSGMFQISFIRYVADRLFERQPGRIIPDFSGVLLLAMGAGLLFVLPLTLYLFHEQGAVFIAAFVATFTSLCGIWIANVMLFGLKQYRAVVYIYLIAYGIVLALSYFLRVFGINGLLVAFFVGNAVLFFSLVGVIYTHYPSDRLISFDFFRERKNRIKWTLALAGLFYNLGIWVDKFIFWFHPLTGYPAIGKLYASIIYDMPIFLAYVAIIPGLAILFYRLESDFAEKYELFFSAVREGATLGQIRWRRNEIVIAVRAILREILIVQGIFNIILFFTAPWLFSLLKIPRLYLPLFYIDTVGTQIQLGFIATLSILYYLDRRLQALVLALAFLVLNIVFTLLSIGLGPYFFGYGFALSLLTVFMISLALLRRNLEDIEYETFMLQ